MRNTDRPLDEVQVESKDDAIKLPKAGDIVRTKQHRDGEPVCLLGDARPDRIKWIDYKGWFMAEGCHHTSSTHSWTFGSYEVLKESGDERT